MRDIAMEEAERIYTQNVVLFVIEATEEALYNAFGRKIKICKERLEERFVLFCQDRSNGSSTERKLGRLVRTKYLSTQLIHRHSRTHL